jgi:hypothetical protein
MEASDPQRAKPLRDKLEAQFHIWKILVLEPHLAELLMDNVLPIVVMPKMETSAPNLALQRSENELPIFTRHNIDTLPPQRSCCLTDTQLPKTECPKILAFEANLAVARKLRADAILISFTTDKREHEAHLVIPATLKLLPNLAKLLIDIALPNEVASKTES